MDDGKLREIVEAIPRGHWMSYGDVTRAAGGTVRQAIGLNQRLTRLGCPGAHRVLKAEGAVAPTALGDAEKVMRRLRREGLKFENGKADPERRVIPAAAAV